MKDEGAHRLHRSTLCVLRSTVLRSAFCVLRSALSAPLLP